MQTALYILICFLAIFGVYEIMYHIALLFFNKKTKKFFITHKVLIADESNAGNLEEFVRDAEMKEEEDLIIINTSSNSETDKLLYLIESEFSFVSIMTLEKYIHYICRICTNTDIKII